MLNKDTNGCEAENSVTIIINLHLTEDGRGMHYSIQVDDVVFSFGKSGVYIGNPSESNEKKTKIIISGVPYSKAKHAVAEALKYTFGDVQDDNMYYQHFCQHDGSIRAFFEQNDLFGYLGQPYKSKMRYSTKTRPCAWFVDSMLQKMGISDLLSNAVGSFLKPDDYDSNYTGRENSKYLRANEYAGLYGITFGCDLHLLYQNDVLIRQ